MGRRTWNKRDWYQYHKGKAIDSAIEAAAGPEKAALDSLDAEISELMHQKRQIDASRSLTDYFVNFLVTTSSGARERAISTQLERLRQERVLAYQRFRLKAKPAAASGAADYNDDRLARAEAKVEAAIERRLRYLERSPSIRSAQAGLKSHMLAELDQESDIPCYYCTKSFRGAEIHLEHKTPVVRGGTNARSNLVLACRSCNLRKGSKTEAEFIKYLLATGERQT